MYEIRITKTETVRKIKPKEWKVIGQKEDGSAKYDYTPEVETLVTETNEIYRQLVDDLDLLEVIAAVNSVQSKPTIAKQEH